MKNTSYSIFFLGLALCFCACKNDAPKDQPNNAKKPAKSVSLPSFNQDSAYAYIQKQVDFGPRVPNMVGHKACGTYLAKKFAAFGCKVIEQEFVANAWDGTKLQSKNIIASFNPTAQKRILLAAHWDTRPYADQDDNKNLHRKPIDGANDGASGVGVLLELARALSAANNKLPIGVDFILFDSEDYGAPEFAKGESKAEFWCLGSQYWSLHKHAEGYQPYYGILLDMIGAKDARFYQEEGSVYYAESVVDKVWKKGQDLGFGHHFVSKSCPSITDDHYFVNKITGIKMIDIIQFNDQNKDQFFGEYWHTHDDNLQVIDKKTLFAVGQTLLGVLYSE
jgi:glutaminyl-peptide cyclotransferase